MFCSKISFYLEKVQTIGMVIEIIDPVITL